MVATDRYEAVVSADVEATRSCRTKDKAEDNQIEHTSAGSKRKSRRKKKKNRPSKRRRMEASSDKEEKQAQYAADKQSPKKESNKIDNSIQDQAVGTNANDDQEKSSSKASQKDETKSKPRRKTRWDVRKGDAAPSTRKMSCNAGKEDASHPTARHKRRGESDEDGTNPELNSKPKRGAPQTHARNANEKNIRGRRSGKLKLPDDWDRVPFIGRVIPSARFVGMRVPLDHKFNHHMRTDFKKWSPERLLTLQEEQELDIRLVIDLTNTFKYYDGEKEFQGTPIEYVKLRIEGFKAPPKETEVQTFMQIVDDFFAKSSEGTIAVHCTHGLNRTGYMIASYLIRRMGWSVTDALKAFNDSRPPGLIKRMYVEDLYERFGQGEEVILPTLPQWASAKYAKRKG